MNFVKSSFLQKHLYWMQPLWQKLQPNKHSSWWRRYNHCDKSCNPANIRLDEDVLPKRLQDVFKKFSRRLAKTSSRHLQDVFKTSCKDIVKTFSRHIIKLNTSLRSIQHVSLTFLSKNDYLQREGYAQVTLLLINLWWMCKICNRDKHFSSFSFSIYYTF